MYVNTAQWRANTIYEQFISERNKDTFCKLEGNKNDEFLNEQVKNDRFWELEQYKNEFLFGNGKEQFWCLECI